MPKRKRRKGKDRCEGCGEGGRIEPVVMQINGKKAYRADLCSGCIMVKMVAIHDHKRHHG